MYTTSPPRKKPRLLEGGKEANLLDKEGNVMSVPDWLEKGKQNHG